MSTVSGLLALGFLILTLATGATAPLSFISKPDTWFLSSEGASVISNVLAWQTTQGSWPKNVDTTSPVPVTRPQEDLQGTFDNGATTGELRLLARAYLATTDPPCETAVFKGIDHVLKAQYPTGGWPQYYPPSKQYHRHITFNDDTMVRLLELLRDVGSSVSFRFVDPPRRAEALASFRRGVECIVRCQIRVKGRLTAWCAQHDEVDYSPRGGRSYELPSISGAESARILELLMSIERPSADVERAIRAGVAWFESAKVRGIRVVKTDGDKRAIRDPEAPVLWARFYDLDSGRPFFCDRDGIKKFDFNELGRERRNGYAWYGDWGIRVAKAFVEWEKRQRSTEATIHY